MRRLATALPAILAFLALGVAPAPAMHRLAAAKPAKAAHRHRSSTAAKSACRRLARARGGHRREAAKKRRQLRCPRATRKSQRAVPAATGGLIVGLNANAAGWGGASTAGYLDQVTSQTGTKWLREDFDWAKIEPSPGVFDFSYYDHFMLQAAQRGLHILAVLYGSPSWSGGSGAIPADPSNFAAYTAAVIDRYGPHGSFWAQHPELSASAIGKVEIWNEPFFSSGDDGDYDPGRYARLVKAAGIAAHAADPEVQVLLEAEMESARDASGNWQWWVDALYQAVPDLNNYFDGVAMHDYGDDTTTLNRMIPGQPYSNYGHMLRIENLRQQFVDHGASDKPFWITEVGWSTCTQPSEGCVGQQEQADDLTTLLSDVHTLWSTWIQAVFVYSYQDGSDPTNVQDGYGLTDVDGSEKPALSVFRSAAVASAG